MIDLETKSASAEVHLPDAPLVAARHRPVRTVLVALVAAVVAVALAMAGSIAFTAPPPSRTAPPARGATPPSVRPSAANRSPMKTTTGQPVPQGLQSAIERAGATGKGTAAQRAALAALTTAYTSTGARVANGGHVLTITPKTVGRGPGTSLGTPSRSTAGDRTTFAYAAVPGFTSWYVAQRSALEEGFTVAQRPSGNGATVAIAVSSSGNVIPAQTGPHALALRAASGTVMTDHGLRVTDATGRMLPSHFDVVGRTITISYDDAAAVYPVTVDPWVQTASLPTAGPTGTFGTAVAVSSDGLTAVVGDPSAGINVNSVGQAFVYYDNAGTWSAGTSLIVPPDSLSFGSSVAISANGTTVLVGDPFFTNESAVETGAVYAYTLSGATWSPPTALTVPDTACALGTSLSLSGDGLTALVGDPDDSCNVVDGSGVGAAWVYTNSDGVWSASPTGLTQPDTASVFGTAVALSSGTTTTSGTAVVGDPAGGTGVGAATVYTLSAGTWTAGTSPAPPTHAAAYGSAVSIDSTATHTVVGDPGGGATLRGAATEYGFSSGAWHATNLIPLSNEQSFGFAVSIAEGTSMIAVGDPQANTVRTYTQSTGFTAHAVVSPTGSAAYGNAVSLDSAGTLLVVGDPQGTVANSPSPSGLATVATYIGTAWAAASGLNQPSSPGSFGTSVALSSNGLTAIVGDPGASAAGGGSFTGAATIFTYANGAWDGGSQLPTPAQSIVFGTSVALSGDGLTALVGDDQGGPNQIGAATIFNLVDGKIWAEGTSLAAPSTDVNEGAFGISVALDGNGAEAIVGDTFDQGTGVGDADVYTLTSGVWSSVVQLTPPGTAFEFGASVSFSSDGTTALVGDYEQGASVFTLSDGVWSQPTSLVPPSGSVAFGTSVSLDAAGTEALIGDPQHVMGLKTVTGAAVVYTYDAGTSTWSTGTSLTLPAGSSNFGQAVSLSPDGESALVGDPFFTSDSVTTGAAYSYTGNGTTWSSPLALPLPTDFTPFNFGSAVAIAGSGLVALVGDPSGGDLQNGAADTYSLPPSATQLAITTSPVTGPAGTSPTIGQITVQLENSAGMPFDATSPVTVTLGSSSPAGVFSANYDGSTTTSVVISEGDPSVNFYYADTIAGSPTITASSAGLLPATQVETITPGTVTKLGVTSGATASLGSPLSVTVTAEDQFGNTTPSYAGTVFFTSSDSAATLPANYTFVPGSDEGTHVFSVTFKTAGPQTVSATDTVSATITGTDDVTVGKGTLSGTVSTVPAGTVAFDDSVTYKVSGVTPSSPAPTGTVTFTASNTDIPSTTLCTTPAISGGTASCSASNAPGGSDTITATYNGDSNYNSGASMGSVALTVTRATTTTNPGVSPNPTYGGDTVTYSASVTTGSGTPTGTVTFVIDSTTMCIETLSAGSGDCTSNLAPVGTDTVTANYSGDVQFAPSTANTTNALVVNPPLSVSTTPLPGGTFGAAYDQTLSATGGQSPYDDWVVSSGSLPAGLNLDSSSGAITGTPTATGTATFTVQVSDSETPPATATSGSLSITIGSTASAYTPVNPYRICDTRGTNGLVGTNAQCAGQRLSAAGTLTIAVSGTNPSGTSSGGVPASGVAAVVLNVTATGEAAQGYLTVWPAGATQPNASSLNYRAAKTVPNLVTVGVSASGQVSFYSLQATDLVVDVEGYYAAPSGTAGLFNSVTPYRICDTRGVNGLVGTNAQCAGHTLSGGQTLTIQVTGTNPSGTSSGGLPASGVSAVVLNVTAVGHGTGYLTAWPAGVATPTASNLNFSSGQVVPNRVIVPVGTDGQVSFTTNTSVDVIVDVNGWFTDGSSDAETGALFVPTTPARICDTRSNANSTPCAGHTVAGGTSLNIAVAGQGPVPASGVVAVVANITAADTSAQSYLSAWPTGAPQPNASDLNWVAGLNVPNMAVVGLGTGGDISVYVNSGSADVLVDVTGWYVNEG